MFPDVRLFIDGNWADAEDGRVLPIVNPATEETIGTVAHAGVAELDRALAAAERGFRSWSATSAFERSKVLRRAAELLRQRVDDIAPILTQEQGKPLREARTEVLSAADMADWFAEEGRRTYGRVIPARAEGISQFVVREPLGPVAAFTPWNFPVSQIVKKLAAALAAGCSVIVKAAEETPASPAELVRAFADAGLPAGAVGLVYGNPQEISRHLIGSGIIRKVSFTGSTAVGKQIASLAGMHAKRVTMELGGHAPALVFDDADVDKAARLLAQHKFRNAGQVCVSPTRFLVQSKVYDRFVQNFADTASSIVVGDGMLDASAMGPLANDRRVAAMADLTGDAAGKGAEIVAGGTRPFNKGYFFDPTVIAGATSEMRAMNEEPFGPLALMVRFDDIDEAIAEANRLPYGLASYAFTRSAKTMQIVASSLQAGMVTINHLGLALPETPFGGVGDSGYGSEGGMEGIEPYLSTKFVTQTGD